MNTDSHRQAGTLARDVMADAARERRNSNVVGCLRNKLSEKQVGDQIVIAVRNGSPESIDG